MVPLLTKMAVEKKCQFEHVILLGNYELAYALGAVARAFAIEKKDSFDNVVSLKNEILLSIKDKDTEDVRIQRLIRVIKEMDSCTEEMNEQLYEVYTLAYE